MIWKLFGTKLFELLSFNNLFFFDSKFEESAG